MATTASEIHNKVKEYLAPGSYQVTEIDYIPDIDDRNIAFGSKGVKLKASVLYLDIRASMESVRLTNFQANKPPRNCSARLLLKKNKLLI